MKEYTLLAIAGVFFAIIVDMFVLKTRLLLTKKFWVFWCVMFVLIFIINGYLTWRPIVMYGEGHYLDIRLFTIPIEDFLYGFALLSLNITIWEFYNKKMLTKK